MVYNALKLFMEINSDYFAEAMEHYKHSKIEYVTFAPCRLLILIFSTESSDMLSQDMKHGRNCANLLAKMRPTDTFRNHLLTVNRRHRPLLCPKKT